MRNAISKDTFTKFLYSYAFISQILVALISAISRYPELLLEVSTEKLLAGHKVQVADSEGNLESHDLPRVDPLLFNVIYYLTASEKEAAEFEFNFPGWDMYLQDFSKESKHHQVYFLALSYHISIVNL